MVDKLKAENLRLSRRCTGQGYDAPVALNSWGRAIPTLPLFASDNTN
jgi:hypothetical protein